MKTNKKLSLVIEKFTTCGVFSFAKFVLLLCPQLVVLAFLHVSVPQKGKRRSTSSYPKPSFDALRLFHLVRGKVDRFRSACQRDQRSFSITDVQRVLVCACASDR